MMRGERCEADETKVVLILPPWPSRVLEDQPKSRLLL